VRIDKLQDVESFTTLDGSEIRELAGQASGNAVNQSLAEATVPPGGETIEHYHRESEEIYFLLEGENFSAFHRLRSDEIWHFYAGGTIAVHVIDPDGSYSKIQLGSDPQAGEVFQAVVKAGSWFASKVRDPKSFALAGCTVAPGFDFADFELGKRSELVKLYPQHRDLIEQFTRS